MTHELTYDNIQKIAESFALKYRAEHSVPTLPTNELEKYSDRLKQKYNQIIQLVQEHTEQFDPEGGHGYEHLEWVSAFAGYIAEKECDSKSIDGERKEQIIDSAILSGILHDIDRHLGFGEDHMIKGEKTAIVILQKCEIDNPLVLTVVRNHDHIDFDSEGNEDLEIIFGSVFDADHFRYGLEREDTFWRMKEKKGKPPEEVIHDYQFLPPYRDAWRTTYGKEAGPKFIDFGMAIAKHIEESFS